MLKTIKLIGVGIIPLFLGFLLNWLMTILPITGFVSILLGLLLLLVWGYCSFKLSSPTQNFILQAFSMCAFGLLLLILVLCQEIIVGAYWNNVIGFATQMFFLPWISLAAFITGPFMNVIRLWPMDMVIWISLFVISCVGCFLKRRK